ncbi:MAG: glycosyltransferase family 39 protein [Kiritimatiellae bacterium]|nr:glycosyltransferase family 39 protein [Kiritimatiellia bacterium]
MSLRVKMLILLALVCAFGLFDHSLWSGNDTREGAMISEMVRTGTWVAPVFNGTCYLEKPPLLHWTGVVFCRLFGAVNEGLVRLPAAVYAFGTLLVVLAWARSMGREGAGFAAAFMCATSALFFEYARIVLTDSALTFMFVFSLWVFWRAQAAEKWFFGRCLLFLFVSAFSFYAKGLIGPGMVWLSVMAWLFIRKKFRFALLLALAFLPVFALVLSPWVFALWKTGGYPYLQTVFWDNQFGRFLYFNDPALPLDPYQVHKEPVYFYLLSLPVRLLPWTLLVIPALYHWFRRESPVRDSLAVFLKTSLLASAFLLHVSSAKAACYALPLFPMIFLMTAVWLEDAAMKWPAAAAAARPSPAEWFDRLERGLIRMTFITMWIAVIAAPVAYLLSFSLGIKPVRTPCTGANAVCITSALLAVLAGLFLGNRLRAAFREGRRRSALLTAPVLAAIIGLVGGAVFVPAVDYYRTYVPFTRMVRGEIKDARRIAFASDSERDIGAFMFYLDSRLAVVSATNTASLENFLNGKERAGIIVPVDKLRFVLHNLRGYPCRVKRADHSGKKSDSFRLMIVNPDGGRLP